MITSNVVRFLNLTNKNNIPNNFHATEINLIAKQENKLAYKTVE